MILPLHTKIAQNALRAALDGKPFLVFNLSELSDDYVHLANIIYQIKQADTDTIERKQLLDMLYIIFGEKPFSK